MNETRTTSVKDKKSKNKVLLRRKRQDYLRLAIQILFFFGMPSAYSSAFNGIKNTITAIGSGQVLAWSSFLTYLLAVCILTMLFGRIFCGWVCAFGLMNDLVYRFSAWIQKKMKIRLPRLSSKVIHALQKGKYLILIGVLGICFLGKSSDITANSPWTAFSLITALRFHLLKSCKIGMIVLLLLIPGMTFQERFFCQFLCPMGAVLSMLPQLPFFQMRREIEKCPAKCEACQKVCPVELKVEQDNPLQGECICCGKCKYICPRKNIHWIIAMEKGIRSKEC